jgi:hypothetical protein
MFECAGFGLPAVIGGGCYGAASGESCGLVKRLTKYAMGTQWM